MHANTIELIPNKPLYLRNGYGHLAKHMHRSLIQKSINKITVFHEKMRAARLKHLTNI